MCTGSLTGIAGCGGRTGSLGVSRLGINGGLGKGRQCSCLGRLGGSQSRGRCSTREDCGDRCVSHRVVSFFQVGLGAFERVVGSRGSPRIRCGGGSRTRSR